MQASLLFVISALSGPLFDMGYMRSLVFVGSTLTVLGMMLISICKAYWQFFLCQGVLIGIGNGLLFLCAVTNIGQYFTTRKAIATGLAGTGANVGESAATSACWRHTELATNHFPRWHRVSHTVQSLDAANRLRMGDKGDWLHHSGGLNHSCR